MPQIIVDIDPAGNVKVEANGMTGSGCQAVTAAIEQAIGVTTGDVKKPEFHRTQQAVQKAEQR